jgi:alanyl-tRNA synthetase
MQADQIRQSFLDYFARRDHQVVRSAPLIPRDDPTLLFNNAGMNQFKDVFLGKEKREYVRAASSQKCVRAGGKHNDLEVVGLTTRHLTFFEMLGNFSFGDYFKSEAIQFGWEFLTRDLGLDGERLHATVFDEDDEAYELWRGQEGLPAERVSRLDAKDNFWAMGDTGPCGPCSEIHLDNGPEVGCRRPECSPACDCGRFVELWNLVFMQYTRDASGKLDPLPSPSIDTGAGLERLAMVLQGVDSVFKIDLIHPIIEAVAERAGIQLGDSESGDIALRVIGDHLRSVSFLLTDGVMPANDGRGYVLRRILRRAVRFALKLGFDRPVLHEFTPTVVKVMGGAYPELGESERYVRAAVQAEEERFHNTLGFSGKVFADLVSELKQGGETTVPGKDAFKLYDTYGLPMDVLVDMASDEGLSVDRAGFEACLEAGREQQRRTWKGGSAEQTPAVYLELLETGPTRFVGYGHTAWEPCRVVAVVVDGQARDSVSAPAEAEVILDVTPFYAESGGQVGDRGVLVNAGLHAAVEDTTSPVRGLTVHRVRLTSGTLAPDDQLTARVEESARRRTAMNHSATHLMHAALRDVLGDHVKQAGSLVAPERLRFDFSHFARVDPRELARIEQLVNRHVIADHAVDVQQKSMDDALAEGALAFFGDRYGDQVRVVTMGDFSKELCGGTHTPRTGNIGYFQFTSEQGIAAGVRRVEAVTGEQAVVKAVEHRQQVEELAERLHATPSELVESVERLQTDLKQARREVADLKLRLAQAPASGADQDHREIAGIKVTARRVEGLDAGGMRSLADELRKRLGSGVVVLGTQRDGKAALLVSVTADLAERVPANLLAKELAARVGGRGGGRPEMAQAGGPEADKLDAALEASFAVIRSHIAS